jgi:flagellar assembly protein FliH
VVVCHPERVVNDPREVLSIRDQAEADGYQAGYQAGLDAAAAEARQRAEHTDAEVRGALSALASATAQAQQAMQREQSVLEAAACELSFAIAEAIVARELALAANPGLDAVMRVLAEIPVDGTAVLRCHPADVPTIAGAGGLPEGTKLVGDATVGRGGCVLDLGTALIDARIETALQRVHEVFNEASAQRQATARQQQTVQP